MMQRRVLNDVITVTCKINLFEQAPKKLGSDLPKIIEICLKKGNHLQKKKLI